MSAAMEVVRRGKPYEVDAGPGCVIGYGEKVQGECVDRVATVLSNCEHGFFVWLDCEEEGHTHRLQLYRHDRPEDDPVVYCEILMRISAPDWEPVKLHKDPAVPG